MVYGFIINPILLLLQPDMPNTLENSKLCKSLTEPGNCLQTTGFYFPLRKLSLNGVMERGGCYLCLVHINRSLNVPGVGRFSPLWCHVPQVVSEVNATFPLCHLKLKTVTSELLKTNVYALCKVWVCVSAWFNSNLNTVSPPPWSQIQRVESHQVLIHGLQPGNGQSIFDHNTPIH